MCQELVDQKKLAESRFHAAILLKNAINDLGTKDMWLNADVETKKSIKNMLMSTLASDNKKVRKGAAQAVSAIANVELPLGEWPEIIALLSANALGENIYSKLGSLETLEFIWEELESSHLEGIDLILSSLIPNIRCTMENEDIKLSAMKTLLQILPKWHNTFKTESECSSLIDHIIQANKYKTPEVCTKAMECLVKIVQEFYDHIHPHIDQLCTVSFKAIANEISEVALQGIELWSSICEEELERKNLNDTKKPVRGYINYCYPDLVKVMLENLSRRSLRTPPGIYHMPVGPVSVLLHPV